LGEPAELAPDPTLIPAAVARMLRALTKHRDATSVQTAIFDR
jgi:hypothetical protein